MIVEHTFTASWGLLRSNVHKEHLSCCVLGFSSLSASDCHVSTSSLEHSVVLHAFPVVFTCLTERPVRHEPTPPPPPPGPAAALGNKQAQAKHTLPEAVMLACSSAACCMWRATPT